MSVGKEHIRSSLLRKMDGILSIAQPALTK
jgi:hypothetical protein